MAIALVQHTNKDQSTAVTSTTLAYGSNVGANNLLICVVRGAGTLTSITITDSLSNSWTNCTFQAVSGVSLQISFAVTTAGANTVTVTPNASSSLRIAIYEYSGTATSSPLDAENNNTTGTGTAANASSITPAAVNELVFGAVGTSAAVTCTAGTNFTIEDQVPSGTARLGTEDWIQTTATATNAPMTLSTSVTWVGAIAVFKPAGAASFQPDEDYWNGPLPPPPDPIVSIW